jgi:hypothetical protein
MALNMTGSHSWRWLCPLRDPQCAQPLRLEEGLDMLPVTALVSVASALHDLPDCMCMATCVQAHAVFCWRLGVSACLQPSSQCSTGTGHLLCMPCRT